MYSKLRDQATGFLYPLSLYFNKLEAFCLYLQYIKRLAVKKPTKAALLSGLVFPGLGHFFLKKRIAGAILFGTALTSLYFLMARSVTAALRITEQIQSGEVDLNNTTITDLIATQSSTGDGQLLEFATAVLVVSWLIGIFDSYRVGRAADD